MVDGGDVVEHQPVADRRTALCQRARHRPAVAVDHGGDDVRRPEVDTRVHRPVEPRPVTALDRGAEFGEVPVGGLGDHGRRYAASAVAPWTRRIAISAAPAARSTSDWVPPR